MVALVVVAVLLVGAAGTGFVLWQERDDPAPTAGDDPTTDPTSDPTADTSSEPTTEPSTEPTDDPGPGDGIPVDPPPADPTETETPTVPLSDEPLSFREFRRDWDFQYGDVELQATFRDGVDHDGCGPAERARALTKIGCADATEWTYRALRGDLALSHLVLTMRSPKAAARAVDESLITEESWRLRPASYLADRPGAWRATDVGQFVVLTVVTHEGSVKQAKADEFLQYANNDVNGALGFRF